MITRPASRGYDLGVTTANTMEIPRPLLTEMTEVIEDTVQYACDQNQISGELMWTVVESLATAKLAELKGLVTPD